MGICLCCVEEEDDTVSDEKDYLFANVNSYDGQKNKKKQRHGKGVYYYANGDIYDGDWDKDKKHGRGEYRFKSGQVLIGFYKNDKYTGPVQHEELQKESGKKKKKSKKNKDTLAKPLYMEDDGLIRSTPPPEQQCSAVQNEPPAKLFDPRSQYNGMTEEEKQRKLYEEHLRREKSRMMREKHKETTEKMRQKYKIKSKHGTLA